MVGKRRELALVRTVFELVKLIPFETGEFDEFQPFLFQKVVFGLENVSHQFGTFGGMLRL